MLDLIAFPKEEWYFSAESKARVALQGRMVFQRSSVKKNKVQFQGMVALVTGSMWCMCVHAYGYEMVIMGWLNIHFQCLFLY